MRHHPNLVAAAQPPSPSIQPIAERYPALQNEEVVLSYCAPAAEAVFVAGTFNNWQNSATPLKPDRDGEWTVHLNLKAGEYEYRFIVDGQWHDDPGAAETRPNPHGGRNALLKVGLDERTSLL